MVILDMWQVSWLYKLDKDGKSVDVLCASIWPGEGKQLKHGLQGFSQRWLNSIVKVIGLDLEVVCVQILVQIPL